MNRAYSEFLREQIGVFDAGAPIEEAWMPPSSWYTDPEFLRLEYSSSLAQSWQPIARRRELAEPGSYVTGMLFTEPWVLVRGEDGVLRGFFNTCRHKGREVVQGCGRAGELVCGYHAWTYGLDGGLKRAPKVAGIRNFDRAKMGLPALRIEEWGPWVFANLDPDTPSLRASLPELDERLEASGWQGLRFVGRREWDIGCNWKVYIDNYLDGGYHIPHMHPSLDAQLSMEGYRTELFARSSIQSAPAKAEADARIDFEAAQRIGVGAIYAWMHPNFMLNRYGPCLDSNYVLPMGTDRCRVIYEFYFEGDEAGHGGAAGPGEADRRFVEESMEQSDVTQREDIAICESVQRGLASRSYARGRYAPQLEVGEFQFHRLLGQDYRRALGEESG